MLPPCLEDRRRRAAIPALLFAEYFAECMSLCHGQQKTMGDVIRSAALMTAIVTLSAMTGSGKDSIKIRLSARYFSAPATVQMIVAVEPDPQNRRLRVEANGTNMYTASEVELAGDREPRLRSIQFKDLPVGKYLLRAQVLSTSAVRSQAEACIIVTGYGDDSGTSC
jgi:hypothetical protein